MSARGEFVPSVRAALDGSGVGARAAAYLVQALGRLGEVEEDAARLVRWLGDGTDRRTRASAANAVMSPGGS